MHHADLFAVELKRQGIIESDVRTIGAGCSSEIEELAIEPVQNAGMGKRYGAIGKEVIPGYMVTVVMGIDDQFKIAIAECFYGVR